MTHLLLRVESADFDAWLHMRGRRSDPGAADAR